MEGDYIKYKNSPSGPFSSSNTVFQAQINYKLSSFQLLYSEIMTRNAISESSFHSTEALKGHNINLPTVTLIQKEFLWELSQVGLGVDSHCQC